MLLEVRLCLTVRQSLTSSRHKALHVEHHQGTNGFVELVLWRTPEKILGSHHAFKYRLALIVEGDCVLRYDNEAGKGDHKHLGTLEMPYLFKSPRRLLEDFWHDVEQWKYNHE